MGNHSLCVYSHEVQNLPHYSPLFVDIKGAPLLHVLHIQLLKILINYIIGFERSLLTQFLSYILPK
jgi:hypothetical protein